MTVQELLNDWVDFDKTSGHITFGYNGNRHLNCCMDHKVYAYIKNRYSCLFFSHTTQLKPMCYVLLTHDVDINPLIWTRIRAIRIDWLDGVKMLDKWKRRDDMTDKMSSMEFRRITASFKNELVAEFSMVRKDKYQNPSIPQESWRKAEVAIPDGRTCRIYKKADGRLAYKASHRPKSHTHCWPVTNTVRVDASFVVSSYEDKDFDITGTIPKNLLEEVKMQMVVEKI